MRHKILTCCLLIALASIFGCSKKSAQEYIESAEILYQKQAIDEAILELKNAIKAEPLNQRARIDIGRLYLEKGAFAESEKELIKAIDLGISKDIATPLLVKSMYYQNDFDRVIILTKNFESADLSTTSKVNLFTFLSKIKSEPSEQLDEIVTNYLQGDDLLIAKAYRHYARGELQQALTAINSFQEAQSEVLEKLILTGSVNAQLGNFEDSIEALTQVVNMANEFFIARFQLADVLIRANRHEEAKPYVDYLLALNDKSAYANLQNSQIAFRSENFEEAFTSAELAVQNGIDTNFTNLLAGISAYRTERLESAYRYLIKVTSNLPPNHIGNRLLAEIRLRLGYTDNIADLINKFSGSPELESPIFTATAMKLFQQGDIEQAKEFFAKANALDPDNAENFLREGMVRISDGDASGIANLEAAIEKNKDLDQAWMLLAQAHVENGDIDSAINIAQKWQDIDQANGLSLEAYINLQIDKNDRARELLEKNLKLHPTHPSSTRFLMLLNARERKFDEARILAEALVSYDLSNLQSLIELINIAIEQDDLNSVQAFFNEKIANKQAPVEVSSALALLLNYKKEPEKAILLLEGLGERTEVEVLMILGNLYTQQKLYDKAFDTYTYWMNTHPLDIRGWLRALDILNQTNSYQQALTLANEGANAFPNESRFQILRANFLIQTGKRSESKKILKELREQKIDSPLFKLFDGELALLEGDFEKASSLLSDYYLSYPSFKTAKLLAEALAGSGKKREGSEILEAELIKLPSRFKEIHYVAEYYTRYELYADAASHYESLVSRYPDHLITLNNYANVLLQLEKYDDAFTYATKALQVVPDSPYFIDTVGWVLYKQEKINDALVYIRKAHDMLPNNVEIQLHLAEVYIAAGRTKEASTLLQRISTNSDAVKRQISKLRKAL